MGGRRKVAPEKCVEGSCKRGSGASARSAGQKAGCGPGGSAPPYQRDSLLTCPRQVRRLNEPPWRSLPLPISVTECTAVNAVPVLTRSESSRDRMARLMAARSARNSERILVTSIKRPFRRRSADSLVRAHTGYRSEDSTLFHRRMFHIDHSGRCSPSPAASGACQPQFRPSAR